ncbi:MAG: hypothetical protein KBC84_09950, partial [Proteobacteria bacterium]|nr:hypothetical protein [Pseudomonadota bacterium]
MIKILAYCLFLLVVLPSSAFSESTTATESNVPAVKKHKRQRVHIDRKDDELVIRNITIEIRDIFDEENPSAFYSTANQLKIKTKQDVVKRELLFKEGDKFNKFVVEESLRNLRQLSYVRNVSIKPTYGKDYVDVIISVQDTWTIFPFVSFSQGGGTKKQSFGITESNLLGYGKRLDVFYADEAGRKKIEGVYDDSRFLDTYNRLTVGLFERTDGYRSFVNLGKPFRSFIQTDSWKLDADLYNLVNKNYRHGEEKFLFREEHQDFSGGYTVAFGNAEKYVRRYTVGYDFYNADFSKASNQDVADVDSDPNQVITRRFILAPDRRFSGPFMALQYVEPDFVSMNYLDRFDRVEDYNLGNELLGRLTVAPDILGSFDNTLLMNLSDSDGLLLSEDSFFRGKVGGSSRLDDSGFRNSVYNLDLRYYNKLGDAKLDGIYFGRHTFAASLSAIFTYEYDRDKQLLVGNST